MEREKRKLEKEQYISELGKVHKLMLEQEKKERLA